MSKLEMLISEVEQAPEPLLDEVLDFVRFLKSRQRTAVTETMLMSESALSKDWLRPEEDEAWKDL